MKSSSTGSSISFNVYGSGPTGHMNVATKNLCIPTIYGFRAIDQVNGLVSGWKGSLSDGRVENEGDMKVDRPYET